jgi:hypothetical protein
MAVDFSVMQSAATVPMKAQFTPTNLTGSIEEAYSLAGTMADTQTKMRTQQSAQNDRAAVQNYIRSGGDLFTPPGIERALTQLRGRVSPEYFTRLGEQAQKLKTADIDLQKKISGLREDELSAYSAGIESAMPFLDALQRQYEADLEAGGAESALAKFNDNRAKLVTTMQGRMVGPNTPMFNEQVVQSLQVVTPEVLPGMVSASKYQTTKIKNALEAARAKAASTGKTENLVAPDGKVVANVPGVGLVDTATGNQYTGNPAELKPMVTGRGAAAPTTGRDWEQYTDPQGNIYESSRTLRQTVQVNKDGTRTEVPSLPADAFRVGSVAAARALVKPGDVPDLTPDENAKLAEFSRVYGRQIPVPSFGTGAAARQDRVLFLRNFVQDMASRGETPTSAGVQASMARAGQEALKRITTQDVILSAGEKELLGILDKMEAELKKIGGPDSPLVRRYWNRAATEIAGDPTFSGMNALYTAFIDEAARVTSGATGAAGTPVAYKQLAERMLDPNTNLSQLMAFKQPFKDMIEARQRGVEGAKQQLITSISPPPRRSEGTTVPPATQAGRDQDRTTILRQEYDAALQRMNTATDPTARSRAMADARSTREELRRLGVDVPPPGEPTAAAAPAADQTRAIRDALRKANRTYEPDKFDYRIGPDGMVQQRRKVQ